MEDTSHCLQLPAGRERKKVAGTKTFVWRLSRGPKVHPMVMGVKMVQFGHCSAGVRNKSVWPSSTGL